MAGTGNYKVTGFKPKVAVNLQTFALLVENTKKLRELQDEHQGHHSGAGGAAAEELGGAQDMDGEGFSDMPRRQNRILVMHDEADPEAMPFSEKKMDDYAHAPNISLANTEDLMIPPRVGPLASNVPPGVRNGPDMDKASGSLRDGSSEQIHHRTAAPAAARHRETSQPLQFKTQPWYYLGKPDSDEEDD